MKALQRAVGGARTPAALRPARLVQRRGLRQAPVRAMLEQVVTTEDERLRVAEVAAALDRRLSRDFSSDSGAAAATSEQPVAPGDDDRTRFQLHWSVDMVGRGLCVTLRQRMMPVLVLCAVDAPGCAEGRAQRRLELPMRSAVSKRTLLSVAAHPHPILLRSGSPSSPASGRRVWTIPTPRCPVSALCFLGWWLAHFPSRFQPVRGSQLEACHGRCCGPNSCHLLPHPSLPSAPSTQADRIRQFTETLANAVSTAGILGSSETARYW